MKTTHLNAGNYVISGHTKANELVQYEITKNGHGWSADLLYGRGINFNQLFSTKAEAVQAINNQG